MKRFLGPLYATVLVLTTPFHSLANRKVIANNPTQSLSHSIAIGDLKSAMKAVGQGADLTTTSPDGKTVLMLAVAQNHLSAVKRLVAMGVSLDTTDKQGRTALMYLKPGKPGVAVKMFLLMEGADYLIRDNLGRTYFFYVVSRSKLGQQPPVPQPPVPESRVFRVPMRRELGDF